MLDSFDDSPSQVLRAKRALQEGGRGPELPARVLPVGVMGGGGTASRS